MKKSSKQDFVYRFIRFSKFSSVSMLFVWSWVFVAILAAVAVATAATHMIANLLPFLLIFPLTALVLIIIRISIGFFVLTRFQRLLLVMLACIWTSHFLQVLVPETGFDAVWYHLPVLQQLVLSNGFTTSPTLYQLLYPLWSDLAYLPAFVLARDLGAKVTAFGGGIALVFSTFALSRMYLTRTWSLLTVLTVSTFQVVAWQSASFYIDVFIACFIVGGMWHLLFAHGQSHAESKVSVVLNLCAAGVLFGFAIGSKHFNIALLVPIGLSTVFLFRKIQPSLLTIIISGIVAMPWYIHAYNHTQQWLYPALSHWSDLTGATGSPSSLQYLFERFISLPLSLIKVVIARDYVSPIVVLAPFVIAYLWLKNRISKNMLPLVIFFVFQWGIWWFIPPLSSRYALAGFIIAVILVAIFFQNFVRSRRITTAVISILLLMSIVNMIPRLYVNYRSLMFLSGQQSKEEYLHQFLDGNLDGPLRKWHKLL